MNDVNELNSLLSAVCRAIRSAAEACVDREILEHWCKLLFQLDCGSIGHCGLIDLWSLLRTEARRRPAYALAPAARVLHRQLKTVDTRELWAEIA